jgi:cystathionine beta-lyase
VSTTEAARKQNADVLLAELRRRRSAKWSVYPPDVLPAWVAEMDFELAPPVKAALREAIERDDVGYAGGAYDGLKEAFAGFAQRRLGWPVDVEQVTLVPDVIVGIAEILRVVTEPGGGVVVNPPVYPPFFSTIAEVGRRVVEVPLDGAGALDLEGLERALAAGARAYVLCNPHNPTGRVATRAELVEIAELAARYDAWVLADEIHAPLVEPGVECVPFLTVSDAAADRSFAFSAASKAFNLPGLKAGLVVTASDGARAQAARMPFDLHYRAGLLGVLAGEAAFAHGDDWLDETLAVLRANRRLLGDLLAEQIPEARLTEAQATFLAWIDCRRLGLGDDPAAAFLQRGRVALSRGLDFGAPGAGHVRLNIGTPPVLVEEAVLRMAASLP